MTRKCWCGKPVTNDPLRVMCDAHRATYAPEAAKWEREKARLGIQVGKRRRKALLNATVPGAAVDTSLLDLPDAPPLQP